MQQVVLVDDDPICNFINTKILQQFTNFEVIGFNRAMEALEHLRAAALDGNLPRLILLDINMPVMNGWEFLNEVEADPRYKDIAIVMVTSSIALSDLSRSKAYASVKGYISKPITVNSLHQVLSRLETSSASK